MITRTLGVGAFPDVCAHADGWVVASHEGDTLVVHDFSRDGHITGTYHIQLDTTSGLAFPRVWSDGRWLWLAYRESLILDRAWLAVRREDGAWRHEPLTPCGGNHPVALGHGYIAWQDRASGRIRRRGLAGDNPVIIDAGPVCAVGLSRIMPDGTVLTMDHDNTLQAGITRPCWADDYVVGEHPTDGIYVLSTASQKAAVAHQGRLCKTPRMAVSPDGRLGVVTWGDYLPVLFDIIDPDAELSDAAAPILDTDTGPKDTIAYFLGDPSTYPHATGGGDTWDVTTNPQQKLITAVLGNDPTTTQVWRFDNTYLYLHWDDWKQAQPGDKKQDWGYTFTDGRWLRRMMAPGDSIMADRNRIQWVERGTGKYQDAHGLPYRNTLHARYLAYPCGRLGMRPAIEWHYAIGDSYREVNISVRGWGLYQWSAEKLVNGAWETSIKGLPIDRTITIPIRVSPHPPPLPTTIFPVVVNPPSIKVTSSYPRVLTGSGDETIIEWTDRNNPSCSGKVWLDNGSVRVAAYNAVGGDVTGASRPIELRPGGNDV